MPHRDGSVRLRHMLDHAREALALAAGRNRGDLNTDRMLNLSLVRLLEIIGEAAGRATEEERNRCSCIPWAQIIGLRNRLIHGYDSVDFDVLWQIISADLPVLVSELERCIETHSS
jgi:uncharacterized protein with HEPN domain